MTRRLLNLLTPLSLLLFVAVAVLWVRSYFAWDEVTWARFLGTEANVPQGRIPADEYFVLSLNSSRGEAGVEWFRMGQDAGVEWPAVTYFSAEPSQWSPTRPGSSTAGVYAPWSAARLPVYRLSHVPPIPPPPLAEATP